ncbi:MAG: hypothetical protein ABIJ81_01770 [Patescibacteria group bacterium]
MPDIKRGFKGREVEPTAPVEREKIPETVAEQPAELTERKVSAPAAPPIIKPTKTAPVAAPAPTSALQAEIEIILQEDLVDLYRQLSQAEQQAFKIKGEVTAFKIEGLMRAVKVKVQEIIKLLIEWLKILPGVNMFFIEQEAKIKAEKILKLKH